MTAIVSIDGGTVCVTVPPSHSHLSTTLTVRPGFEYSSLRDGGYPDPLRAVFLHKFPGASEDEVSFVEDLEAAPSNGSRRENRLEVKLSQAELELVDARNQLSRCKKTIGSLNKKIRESGGGTKRGREEEDKLKEKVRIKDLKCEVLKKDLAAAQDALGQTDRELEHVRTLLSRRVDGTDGMRLKAAECDMLKRELAETNDKLIFSRSRNTTLATHNVDLATECERLILATASRSTIGGDIAGPLFELMSAIPHSNSRHLGAFLRASFPNVFPHASPQIDGWKVLSSCPQRCSYYHKHMVVEVLPEGKAFLWCPCSCADCSSWCTSAVPFPIQKEEECGGEREDPYWLWLESRIWCEVSRRHAVEEIKDGLREDMVTAVKSHNAEILRMVSMMEETRAEETRLTSEIKIAREEIRTMGAMQEELRRYQWGDEAKMDKLKTLISQMLDLVGKVRKAEESSLSRCLSAAEAIRDEALRSRIQLDEKLNHLLNTEDQLRNTYNRNVGVITDFEKIITEAAMSKTPDGLGIYVATEIPPIPCDDLFPWN